MDTDFLAQCLFFMAVGGCVGKLIHMALVRATVSRCDREIAANSHKISRAEAWMKERSR